MIFMPLLSSVLLRDKRCGCRSRECQGNGIFTQRLQRENAEVAEDAAKAHAESEKALVLNPKRNWAREAEAITRCYQLPRSPATSITFAMRSAA